MITLTFDRTTEARGRNGWFILDHGHLEGIGEHRWLGLFSKKIGEASPITLRFAQPDDMRTLGRALLDAAEAFAAARDPLDAQVKAEYRQLAEDLREDGKLEFDPGCVVSLSEDGGAYVQSWSWVDGPAPSEAEPGPDSDPDRFLDYWHQGAPEDHWSSPHGCHTLCEACKRAREGSGHDAA
jgi:hypothetical protein